MPRRTLLNAALVKKLCKYISEGTPQKYAAMACGISEPALYAWLHDGEQEIAERAALIEIRGGDDRSLPPVSLKAELKESIVQARATFVARLHTQARNAATHGNMRAIELMLKAHVPEVYGDKAIELRLSGGVGVAHSGTVHHDVDVRTLSDAELRALAGLPPEE